MNFNGRKIAIFAASTVAGMAAGTLTSMVLKQNTEAVKVSEKVARVVGSFVIGAMVQDQAEKYIGKTCNQIFNTIDSIKAQQDAENLANDIAQELEKEESSDEETE